MIYIIFPRGKNWLAGKQIRYLSHQVEITGILTNIVSKNWEKNPPETLVLRGPKVVCLENRILAICGCLIIVSQDERTKYLARYKMLILNMKKVFGEFNLIEESSY